MTQWELPTSLEISGVVYDIRTDYRAIIDILTYMSDPEYENDEKWLICLDILYIDFDNMPSKDWKEACIKAKEFIDMGIEDDGKPKPALMDWEQDAAMIIPAVNRVIGQEVRALKYMHWWTFLAAYLEIGECSFSNIISLRSKRAKNKKLDKWEKDFIRENSNLVNIKKKMTVEEREQAEREREALKDLL